MINSISYYDFTHISNFYLISTITTYTVVYVKITNNVYTYLKTQYLCLLLLYLSVLIALVNFNYLIPVYLSIEFGTIVYILSIVRSNSSVFIPEEKLKDGTTIFWVIVMLVPSYYFNKNMFLVSAKSIFMDLYSRIVEKNDFYTLYLCTINFYFISIVLLMCMVVLLTVLIVKIKSLKDFPNKQSYRPYRLGDIDIFQKNKEIFYFSKKNIISYFRSN